MKWPPSRDTVPGNALDGALRSVAAGRALARARAVRALEDYAAAAQANLTALQQRTPLAADPLALLWGRTLAVEARRLVDLSAQLGALEQRLAATPPPRAWWAALWPALDGAGARAASGSHRRARLGGPFSAAAVAAIVVVAIGFAAFAGRDAASANTRTASVLAPAVALDPPAAPAAAVAARPALPAVAAPPVDSVLAHARVVALYGHPGAPATGALGKYTPEQAAQEVLRLAGEQQAADGRLALGALHMTVGVAQAQPTADGTYLARLTPLEIEPYMEVARRHGLLLILDIQLGWADPLTEVQALEPFLAEPFVHVALDPEFATGHQRVAPGTSIGSLDATAVNAVQDYLAGLVRRLALPHKLLVLHQFRDDMLTGTAEYRVTPGVDVVIDMDGFGPPASKIDAYEQYALAPYAAYPAIKLFFDWDAPLLTRDELAELAQPPALVIYQ